MPVKNITVNRAALGHRVAYALRHPERVPRHVVRAARDAWLGHRHPDHISYYRAVMRSDTRADPDTAVGSRTHERWLALGDPDILAAAQDTMVSMSCSSGSPR